MCMENLNIFVRFVRFVLGFKFNLSHEIHKNRFMRLKEKTLRLCVFAFKKMSPLT